MKIHTTQNLSVLAQQQLSDSNCVSQSELRFKNTSTPDSTAKEKTAAVKRHHKPNYNLINAGVLLSGIAVAGIGYSALARKYRRELSVEDLKKTVRTIKEKVTVGDVKEKVIPKETFGDRVLNSKFFNGLLKLTENEPVAQAAMAACICIILRPLTIMALPNKKGKEDNMYASAHSISSGIMGLVSAFIIAQPFKMGASYTMEKMFKDLDENALKRLFPTLDINSIYKDASKKVRKEVSEWLFQDGNKFIKNFKDVEKIPTLKHISEVSNETFRKLLHADVDWVSQKGKSYNDVVDINGKSLYDVIDWTKLGIIVDQKYTGRDYISKKILRESTGKAQVLLQDLDREFLEKIIKDSDKNSIWKKLDINSVYNEAEQVVDFRKWKELGTDKQWKLDLGNIYVSSPLERNGFIPRISGKHRIDPSGDIKYAAYLKNGKDGKLGSVVDEIMMETDRQNEVHDKLLTWLPDLITRPLVATATIALIPLALKNIFHLEKGKKPVANQEQNSSVKNSDNLKSETANNTEVSFKGSPDKQSDNNISFKGNNPPLDPKPSKFKQFIEKYIAKPLAKIYGKPMYESSSLRRIVEKLTQSSGSMTNHMATLGALLTSSVYMYQTLNKKDLDDDRRHTLAINQCLCFIIPTICAYTVDKLLKNWTKVHIEYEYSRLQEEKILDAKSIEQANTHIKDLGKKLKSVRTLISLAIFSMIYRYVAPVLITPFANKIGERVNERRQAEKEAALQNA